MGDKICSRCSSKTGKLRIVYLPWQENRKTWADVDTKANFYVFEEVCPDCYRKIISSNVEFFEVRHFGGAAFLYGKGNRICMPGEFKVKIGQIIEGILHSIAA